jgi:hypothetical protein
MHAFAHTKTKTRCFLGWKLRVLLPRLETNTPQKTRENDSVLDSQGLPQGLTRIEIETSDPVFIRAVQGLADTSPKGQQAILTILENEKNEMNEVSPQSR